MDRKKTIVAATVINAGILTVLFIAAMTMQDENEPQAEFARKEKKIAPQQVLPPQPLYAQIVEIPSAAPIPAPVPALEAAAQPSSASFMLPTIAAAPAASTEISLVQAAPMPAPAPAQHPGASLEIVVQKGDSLEKLAKIHHTTVDEIIKLNHLPSSFLKAGQQLKIPSENKFETPRPKAPATVPTIPEQAEYYTMKVGDNPWSIAMKYHMKVDELLKLNGLNEKTARKLKPGDRLRIK